MADPTRSRLERLGVALGRVSQPILAVTGISIAVGASGSHGPAGLPSSAIGVDSVQAVQTVPEFTHADHERVECYTCHENADAHGTLTVTTTDDCRRCHHSPPTSAPCARCHAAGDAPDEVFRTIRAVSFSVGAQDPRRTLTFPHGRHAGLDCARCHTQGSALAAPDALDCEGCHQEHHTPQSDCAACHVAAPVEAHPPSEAHVTCSGAACHQSVPFQTVPRTREFCLGCHQDMREHEVARACAECHTLPAPRPQGAGAR
jgi:hypothetical protein